MAADKSHRVIVALGYFSLKDFYVWAARKGQNSKQ